MLHRLIPGLLGLLLSAPLLPAQSSVWKVTRGSSTLYLGGTIHLLRTEDFPLPPEFDTAFRASSKLVFETDISRIQSAEMQRVIASHGTFSDDTTLQKVITPAAWVAVRAYCEKAGLPIATVNQMKPWLFTIMLTAVELQKLGISNAGVDLHYFQQAAAKGKKVGELETFDQHVEFVTRLGAGHESEIITKSLDDIDDMPRLMTGLLTAWRTGNLAQIDTFMLEELRTKYPTVFDELLVSRNRAWLPKIEAFLKTSEVEFVLVGAGHLAGKEGLLAELRGRGYKLEQIRTPAKSAK